MKNSILSCLLLLPFFSIAQYYYRDLVANREINQLMKSYRDHGIRRVTATGSTPQGIKPSGYHEIQEVQTGDRELFITMQTDSAVSYLVYRFDSNGLLTTITDSSNEQVSITHYTYDKEGRLSSLVNTIADSSVSFSEKEEHTWYYANGNPEKMYRVIDNRDSLLVNFLMDDHGNVIEEDHLKNGNRIEQIYYYYDERNRLTDIVRYNRKARRLLPDMMIEYDDQDRVIQKITTTTYPVPGYYTWRYLFNENGLKRTEAMFNKNKELQGRIDYTYQ